MSSILSILKVKFSADTAELTKGTQEGKKAVQDMAKVSGSALDELGQLFGVNIGQISSGFAQFKGVMSGLGAGFKGAAAGSGVLSGALKVLKLALVSTGIGAIVVALGSLIAYFATTNDGADKMAKMMAYVGGFVRALTDRLADLGEKLVWAFENPKEALKQFGEFLLSQVINRFTALPRIVIAAFNVIKSVFSGDTKSALEDFLSATTQLTSGLDKVQQSKIVGFLKDVGKEASKEAEISGILADRLDKLEDSERALKVTSSERERQMKRMRLISSDETKDLQTRLEASKKAMDYELANLADRLKLARELVSIRQQEVDLRGSKATDDQLNALADSQQKLNDLESESLTIQKKLQTEQNNLAQSVFKNREEYDKYLQVIDAQKRANDNLKNNLPDIGKIFMENAEKAKQSSYEQQIALQSLPGVVIDVANTINSAFEDLASGIGEALGNMMAGAGGLSDLGTVVLSSLADMLINVGKLAISTGIAVAGIKTALASLNPAVAIAAGIALVALGSAVKSGLKSASSGSSSGASMSSVASSGVSTIDTRRSSLAMQGVTASNSIEITGTFRQRGSDLVAVVEKENDRRTLTT